MDDREMLIRVEQQMKDATQNQLQIMVDLKDIFRRIENDSKAVSQMKGDFQTFSETSSLKMLEIERRITDSSLILKELQTEIKKEKEERVKDCDTVTKLFNTFQSEMNGSLKTIKWIFTTIAALAAIVSVINMTLSLASKM